MAGTRIVVVLAVAVATHGRAHAGRHVMSPGETLGHVAQLYGCTVDAVLRANDLTTTLVPAGTVVEVPACTRAKPRARPAASRPEDDEARARQALAVIDGTHVVTAEPEPAASVSSGQPWHGRLEHGEALPQGDGYKVRRPQRAFGASHVVAQLRSAIGEVRALFPELHTLAIGDLSAEHGGKIADHLSHQSGLDVDVGFYFTKLPAGYPDAFVAANADLDLEATWALLAAFARTADRANGVEMIFLDERVQARLYAWGKQHGTPDDELAFLFQYPRPRDALVGLVRHWPNHTDHFHVRFKSGH